MKIAIFSDVHANASALRRVLADARTQCVEKFVCLGDIVGYGPEPAEAIRLVQQDAKAVAVAGNNDDAVSGRMDVGNFVDLAADAVGRHRGALRREDREWLASLPYTTYLEGGAICAHGDISAPEEFKYIDTVDDAAWNFAACQNQLIFVGHTHVPCVFLTGRSGRTYRMEPQDFEAEDGKRYIVNVGTVGYPRDDDASGKCMSSYVIYDSATRSVAFRFLPFSVASVMQRGGSENVREHSSQIPTTHDAPGTKHDAPGTRHDARGTKHDARGTSRIVTLAGVVLVVLAVAALVFANRTAPAGNAPAVNIKEVQPAKAQDAKDGEPIVKTLVITGRKKFAYAGLELAKDSPPADVSAEFLNAAGSVISTKRKGGVKRRYNEKLTLPKGAASVRFTVAPVKAGERPVVSIFEPTAK